MTIIRYMPHQQTRLAERQEVGWTGTDWMLELCVSVHMTVEDIWVKPGTTQTFSWLPPVNSVVQQAVDVHLCESVSRPQTVTSVELSIGFVPLFLNIHPLFPLYLLHHSGSVVTSLGQVKGDRTITRSKAYPYQEDLVRLVGLPHICPVFLIQTKERTAPMLNTPPETAVIQSINELLFHPYINQECNPMSSGTSVLPGPGPEV